MIRRGLCKLSGMGGGRDQDEFEYWLHHLLEATLITAVNELLA